MKKQFKQLGQGMTEYIIIIAFIAIAGIGAFTFFGDSLKEQVGNVSEELSGKDSTVTEKTASGAGFASRDMKDFNKSDK